MNAMMALVAIAAGAFFSPPPPLALPPVPVITPPGGEQQYAVNTWYSFEETPCADGEITQTVWIMVTGPVVIAEVGLIRVCLVSDSTRVVDIQDESLGWRIADVDPTRTAFRHAIKLEDVQAYGPWVTVFEDGVEKVRLRALP